MSIERLREIMAALRDPASGCPWDLRQDFSSIADYTLEEAYEVIEAIAREDYAELKDELGDLLFQVVFHSQMAAEKAYFDLDDVVEAICEKMVRRHPHVFQEQIQDTRDKIQEEQEQDPIGKGADADEAAIKRFWEEEKARERAEKAEHGVLDGVTRALPALKRAQKLQKRAARVGFDWPDYRGAAEKIEEELAELAEAVEGNGAGHASVSEEMGDLLFSCVNLARRLNVDAEACLLAANRKFESRFRALEAALAGQGLSPEQCDPQRLDATWEQVKRDSG